MTASSAKHSEAWLPVVSVPSYEISTLGRLRRRATGRIVVGSLLPRGYRSYDLWVGGRRLKRYAHRMVTEAFIGPAPSPKHEAAHQDGDVGRNELGNLAWKTRIENEADKLAHGTLLQGSRHALSKINEADVRSIRARRAGGEMLNAIAADFPIGMTNVALICARKAWAHVS